MIDTWTHANNDVADAMVSRLAQSRGGFNPVYMMMNSGARGSRDQMRQLAGMRGLMAKPQKKLTGGIGEIIESPIKANFREGLSVLEYFISTHGARKGLADTALKTADAGYLTRRLVDVAQDMTIALEGRGTVLGLDVAALKEGEDVVEPLKDRIVGSVALEDVVDPIDNELIVAAGELIDEETADTIEDAGIQTIRIRSVLTCEADGDCAACAMGATWPPCRWWTWARRWVFWPRNPSASRAPSSRYAPSTSGYGGAHRGDHADERARWRGPRISSASPR